MNLSLKSFGKWIRALSPNCKEAARLQSEKLDHELPLLQKIGLRFHLVLCKWCRRYGKQLGFLRSAARRCDEEHGHSQPQKLPAEALERIKRQIRPDEK